jgi:hypothetical protein
VATSARSSAPGSGGDSTGEPGNDAGHGDAGHGDAGQPSIDARTLSCDFPGSGAWEGTVDGNGLSLPRSAWVAIEADGDWWVVGMDEAGGRCFGAGDPGGDPPASGYRGLRLIFDGTPASGTYDVVPFDTMDAPVDSVWAAIDDTGPGGTGDIAHGTRGTVSVTVAEGCYQGMFEIAFEGFEGAGGGNSTGAFAAYVCSGPG